MYIMVMYTNAACQGLTLFAAGTAMTMGALVAEVPEKESPAPAGAPGMGMGGMM
jgi:hypothetical protein